MVIAIKIVLMIVLFLVLSYPLLPLPSKFRRFSTFYALKYRPPFQKRNLIFLPIVIGEFVVVAFLIETLTTASAWVQSVPFIGNLTNRVSDSISSQANFVLFVLQVLLGNGIVLYAFVLIKGFLKRALIDPLMGWSGTCKMTRAELKERSRQKRIEKKAKKLEKKNRKQAKKKGIKEVELPEEADTDETLDEKTPYVRKFPHSEETDTDQEKDKTPKKKTEKEGEDKKNGEDKPKEELPPIPQSKISQKFYGLFFEAPEYRYARPSVARATAILQAFVYIAEVFYLILFMALAAMVFFPLPPVMYGFLIDTLHIRHFYVYPFISLIFLQELCNFLKTEKLLPDTPEQQQKKQEVEEESKCDIRLNALNAELKKRFDANHCFRYYPEVPKHEVPEYVISNRPYAGALEYIRTYMQKTAHHVVQSYPVYLSDDVAIPTTLKMVLENLQHVKYDRIDSEKYLVKLISSLPIEAMRALDVEGDVLVKCKDGSPAIVIPQGVTEIGNSAFKNCEKLESVNFGEEVRFINNEAFRGCKKLKEIYLPANIKAVGESAFRDCIGLESVIIENDEIEIGERAFENCANLTVLRLPRGMAEIYGGVFNSCKSLENL